MRVAGLTLGPNRNRCKLFPEGLVFARYRPAIEDVATYLNRHKKTAGLTGAETAIWF